MKNSLSTLHSTQLLERTRTLVREELRTTLELIDHLREIERRMLFAELGFGSLFEFCTKHLGLSEGSAQRRISAMRLARDLPEARACLESGSLSLSNASKLQSAFRAQKLEAPQKQEILAQITGLSQRDCESKLFELLPEALFHRERERLVGTDTIELKLVLTRQQHEKFQRLKELLSHQFPEGLYAEILEHLADLEIERLEKKKGIAGALNGAIKGALTAPPVSTAAAVRIRKLRSSTQSIPAPLRRQIWHRAQGRCEFKDCGSRYQLEVDHIQPKALGGTHEPNNLRLLCRIHNAQQARKILGEGLMQKYIQSLN